jgi:hypothetical protein
VSTKHYVCVLVGALIGAGALYAYQKYKKPTIG